MQQFQKVEKSFGKRLTKDCCVINVEVRRIPESWVRVGESLAQFDEGKVQRLFSAYLLYKIIMHKQILIVRV